MKLSELQNKKILIVGYGKEGKATEEFLKSKLPNIPYAIADESQGSHYLDNQQEYDLAIKSPGVHKSKIAIPYTTATNIFFANGNSQNIIGVTGSKGKSTTASLVYHILKNAGKDVRLVGNIGNPLLHELLQDHNEETIYVCELSSYQLDDITYSPHIAVIVSLFPDHLTYHGSESSYYDAKKNIIKYSTENDYYIFNPRFKLLSEWKESTKAKPLPYETDFLPEHMPLLGEHNKDNMRGAITVTRLFDIGNDQIASAIQTFKPLPHRLECVGTFLDITFYDDAISTTPESTIAAMESLQNVKTVFLGGQDRRYDFNELAQQLAEKNIENIVLFPDSGTRVLRAVNTYMQKKPRILETQDMEKAVQFAYEFTPKHAICLLSTASPSYSIWKNFEEKGDLFQTFVKKYAHEKKDS